MYTNQHWLVFRPGSSYKRHVDFLRVRLFERYEFKMSVFCWHIHFNLAADQRFFFNAVLDQIFYGYELELKTLRNFYQVWKPRHTSVFIHNLHQHTGWFKSRKTSEVNRCFGVASSAQNTTTFRFQWKDVSWLSEFFWFRIR